MESCLSSRPAQREGQGCVCVWGGLGGWGGEGVGGLNVNIILIYGEEAGSLGCVDGWPDNVCVFGVNVGIQHPASSILHPPSIILHPSFCILQPVYFIQYPPPASNILHPASCSLHPSSSILSILHPAFSILHPASFILY